MNSEQLNEAATDCDVLIIGGGLVGASLACALENSRHSVRIVEAFPLKSDLQPSYDDRTVALSWGSRCILEGMQVWDAMAGQVEAIKTIHISDKGHFGATRLRHEEERVEALGYVAENRVLGEVLYSRLQQSGKAGIHCPARLIDIEQQQDRVVATISENDSERLISARLLVAADGVVSQVRDLLHIGSSVQDYGQSAVIANVTPTQKHNNIAYERFTDEGPIAFLPMTQNRCSVVWTVPTSRADELMRLDDALFLQQLQQRFGFRLGRLLKTGQRQAYPLKLIESTQVVRKRVVIVGNAAHTIHPVAGQGFNLALRDIAMLTELIVTAEDAGDSALLQAYTEQADERRPLVIGLVAVGLVPPLRHQLARQSMGLSGRASELGRRSLND